MTDIKSILIQSLKEVEDVAMKGLDVTGLPTGFTDFDRITTGLHGGQILIVAARPGMGKTSWFLSALQHAALKAGSVCLVFSLEMSREDLVFRILSGQSKIDTKRLKTGKLADRDWAKMNEAADKISRARVFIDDSGGLTLMDVRARSRRLKAIQGKLDLIVIDYLQLMKGPKSGKGDYSREREIAEISRGLKELSKELKVPIIALSQLNRSVEGRQDKRPQLSDLRESGSIEQDADIVVFIHREDYYNQDTENKGVAELIIAKNRAGEQATIRLSWQGQYQLFSNLAPDQPGTPIGMPRPDRGDITL